LVCGNDDNVQQSQMTARCVFSVFLGVGYYGNRETEKGLDGALQSVASATETIGRIHSLVSISTLFIYSLTV